MAKFNLFGFKIGKDDAVEPVLPSFSPPVLDDGAVTITTAAHFGTTIDLDTNYKSEIELITRYREMSMQPEVESAVDDIINEAIIQDHDSSVDLLLDNLKVSPKVKSAMETEFENILTLLNFKNLGQDIFRRFYVDGRLYYNVIVDKDNVKDGIKELRYTDPRKITKVREINKQKDPKSGFDLVVGHSEYYIYSDNLTSKSNLTQTGIKIAPDSVIAVTSGLLDAKRSIVLSYLHKAIKPLNQLRMIEDASVIYKVSRAPERRIFYIDVGNLPKMKAEQYLKDIMAKYKNKVVYDANTGEVRDDRRTLSMQDDFWLPRRCLSLDTKIKLLDGRDVELSQLIDEHQNGKQNWVYSVSPDGIIVPGKISWAGITKRDTNVIKVILDNGEEIICTPDHKFILRDGSLCEAQNLKEFDSLMPLYTRKKQLSGKYSGDYNQFFNNKSNRWNFTHRSISNYINGDKLKSEVVHHDDFNRYNNNPENLILMDKDEHYNLHSTYGTNSWNNGNFEEHCKNLSVAGKLFFETEQGKVRKAEISKFNKSNIKIQEGLVKGRKKIKEMREYDKAHLSKEEFYSKWVNISQFSIYNEKQKIKADTFEFNKILDIIDNIFYDKITTFEILTEIKKVYPKFSYNSFAKYLPYHGYENLNILLKSIYGDNYKRGANNKKYSNHKVVRIEKLDYKIDTGTLTIDENHEYHNFHNFALSSGIFVKNSDNKTTEITTLPSSAAFDDMSMVEYFEKKLYKALAVPYSRLADPNGAYVLGRSSEISRDEIKFSKFINRIRSKFTDLFDQALRIQCIMKGICTEEEFDQFKQKIYYDFKFDNNYAELKEAELIQNRVTLLSEVDPYVGKYFSLQWIQKKVLNMPDDETKLMKQQIDKEIKEGMYPDPKLLLNPTLGNISDDGNPVPQTDQTNASPQNITGSDDSLDLGNPYYK